MVKKVNVEKYITDKINSGEWSTNDMLPPEVHLVKATGMSKMTVRKAIDRLKEKDVLYAVIGRGTFVSSFHQHSKFKSLKNTLKANKVSYLPSTSKVPQILLNKFQEGYEIQPKNAISFIKIYYVQSKPVAMTMNWVNNEDYHYDKSQLSSGRKSLFEEKRFDKVINIHKMTKLSQSEQNILGKKYEFVPTTYSYYIYKDRKVMMSRVTKILPQYFSAFELLTRE